MFIRHPLLVSTTAGVIWHLTEYPVSGSIKHIRMEGHPCSFEAVTR